MTRMHLASRQGARRRITPDPGDHWGLHAYCHYGPYDYDTWWTETTFGLAMHLCHSHCPVRAQCLAWAKQQKWDGGGVIGGQLHTGRGGWIPPNSRWAPKPNSHLCHQCSSHDTEPTPDGDDD